MAVKRNIALSLCLLTLLAAPVFAQESHWRARVLGGAVQPVTPGTETSTSTQPFGLVDVTAQIAASDWVPTLNVSVMLTGQDGLDLASPETVKSIEGRVTLAQGLGTAIWFRIYGEVGGAALVGSDVAPAFAGVGLRFRSYDDAASLDIGYSHDQRLTGEYENCISARGYVTLKPVSNSKAAFVAGVDWLRQFDFTRHLGQPPAKNQIRIWVSVGIGG